MFSSKIKEGGEILIAFLINLIQNFEERKKKWRSQNLLLTTLFCHPFKVGQSWRRGKPSSLAISTNYFLPHLKSDLPLPYLNSFAFQSNPIWTWLFFTSICFFCLLLQFISITISLISWKDIIFSSIAKLPIILIVS